MAHGTAVSPETLEALKRYSTGMVADALAMAGVQGGNGLIGVHPLRGFEDCKVVGPASTLLFGKPAPGAPKMTVYRAIRASAPGSVLVMDAQGQKEHFSGDNQGNCSKRQGIVGNVVYGGTRDVAGWRQVGQPVWSMGTCPMDKPKGYSVVGHNVPLNLGGVKVNPGDIIIADEDGVVVIPLELLSQVMENLKVMVEVEEGMEEVISRDAPVEELERIISKKKPKA
jgi:4-hydroxy-4-methyl-2-oxoglutarate aldolase